MAERRRHPRKKKRLLVDFDTMASRTTGFTHDLSRSGLFVRTIRIPRIGENLRAVVHLPEGRQVEVEGTVVRSYRVPATLRSLVPSGFGLRVRTAPEEFAEFTASLESSRGTDPSAQDS